MRKSLIAIIILSPILLTILGMAGESGAQIGISVFVYGFLGTLAWKFTKGIIKGYKDEKPK